MNAVGGSKQGLGRKKGGVQTLVIRFCAIITIFYSTLALLVCGFCVASLCFSKCTLGTNLLIVLVNLGAWCCGCSCNSVLFR